MFFVNIDLYLNRFVVSVITVILLVLSHLILKVLLNRSFAKIKLKSNRYYTIKSLSNRILKGLTFLIIIFSVLKIWGVDPALLVTSFGVLGVAFGFGSRELVRDLISGFFIITDKRFEIGDNIRINDFRGEVIDIGVMTTRLKNYKNEILTINNGDIKNNVNYYYKNLESLEIEINVALIVDIKKYINDMEFFIESFIKIYTNDISKIVIRGLSEINNTNYKLSLLMTTTKEQAYKYKRIFLLELDSFYKKMEYTFETKAVSINLV